MTDFEQIYASAMAEMEQSQLDESVWGNMAAGAVAASMLFGAAPKTMAATAPNKPSIETVAQANNVAAPKERPKSFADFRDNYMFAIYHTKIDGLPMLSSEAETFAGPRFDLILGKYITSHETGGKYTPKGSKGPYVVKDGINYVQRMPDPSGGYTIGDGITLNRGVTKFPKLVSKYLKRGVAYDKDWKPLLSTTNIANNIEYLSASVAASIASDFRADSRAALKAFLSKRGVNYDELDSFAKMAVEDLAFNQGGNLSYRKMIDELAKPNPDYVRAAYEICDSADYEGYAGLRNRRIQDAHLMLMAAKRNNGLDIYKGKLGLDSPQVSTNKVEAAEKTGMVKHTVVRGESLWSIARKYHSTVDELCAANNVKPTDVLDVGRVIYIKPVKTENMDATQRVVGGKQPSKSMSKPTRITSTAQYHTVKPGETFSGIAFANGVRLNDLKSLNVGIDYDRIKTGQKVRVK